MAEPLEGDSDSRFNLKVYLVNNRLDKLIDYSVNNLQFKFGV